MAAAAQGQVIELRHAPQSRPRCHRTKGGRNGGPTINWLDWRGMRFDLITIFPEFFVGPLDHGILRRARETGLVEVNVQDLREFTKDRHRTVDDRPFGGGEGMVLKPEPVFEAVESLLGCRAGEALRPSAADPQTAIVLLSAAGKLFGQETARRYARLERLILICGRYEGVDERVAEHLATEELSIGDFVLSGGELPAMMVVDAVTRLLPGALGNEASSQNESFSVVDNPGPDTSQQSRVTSQMETAMGSKSPLPFTTSIRTGSGHCFSNSTNAACRG